MTTDEIMSEIIKQNKEREIFLILSRQMVSENERFEQELLKYRSQLRAIHKINDSVNNSGKHEAIANLSELEEV